MSHPIESVHHIRHPITSERKKVNFIKIESRHPAAAPTTVSQNGEGRNREEREEGDSKKYVLNTTGQVYPFLLIETKRTIDGPRSDGELQIDFDCIQVTDSIPT